MIGHAMHIGVKRPMEIYLGAKNPAALYLGEGIDNANDRGVSKKSGNRILFLWK